MGTNFEANENTPVSPERFADAGREAEGRQASEGAESRLPPPGSAVDEKRRVIRRRIFEAYEEAKRKSESPEHARERLEPAGKRIDDQPGSADERFYNWPDPPGGRKKLFSEIPRIEGELIVLDRIVDSDADALRDLVDNQLVQRYLPTYLFENQLTDAHEAIRLIYGDLFRNKESLILAIRPKETGELAGLAEFYGLRDRLHKISVGCRLRERWWGCGLAAEAARLMVNYLYGETDIEIITASTRVENKAAARSLEKADFIRTACGVEEDWGFPEPTIVDKWFC